MNQTKKDLLNHFNEQVKFLKASSYSYDKGFYGEAKRLACTIAVLVYDSKGSISLFTQLRIKNIRFYDTGVMHDKMKKIMKEKLGESGRNFHCDIQRLVCLAHMGPDPKLYPPLLEDGLKDHNKLSFNDWWHQKVIDDSKNKFTRKDIVLSVRNKDGGAHVDPKLDKKYMELSRLGSADLTLKKSGNIIKHGPELGTIRQITFELLRSIDDQIKNKGHCSIL